MSGTSRRSVVTSSTPVRDERTKASGPNWDIDAGRPLLYDLAIGAEAIDVVVIVRALDEALRGRVQ